MDGNTVEAHPTRKLKEAIDKEQHGEWGKCYLNLIVG